MSGRLSSVQVFSLAGAADNLIVGPNPHRVRIIFSCQNAGVGLAINTRALTAKDDGMSLSGGVNGGILELSLEQHGNVVTKAWHAFSGVAANLGVLEVIDDDSGIPGGSYQYAH